MAEVGFEFSWTFGASMALDDHYEGDGEAGKSFIIVLRCGCAAG